MHWASIFSLTTLIFSWITVCISLTLTILSLYLTTIFSLTTFDFLLPTSGNFKNLQPGISFDSSGNQQCNRSASDAIFAISRFKFARSALRILGVILISILVLSLIIFSYRELRT